MIILVVLERFLEQLECLFYLLLPLKVVVDLGSLQDFLIFNSLAEPVEPVVQLVCERFGTFEGGHCGICGLSLSHRGFVLSKDLGKLSLSLDGELILDGLLV